MLQEGVLISFSNYCEFVPGSFFKDEIRWTTLREDPFNMGCIFVTYVGGYLSKDWFRVPTFTGRFAV